MNGKWYFLLGLLIGSIATGFAMSCTGQYHPISEICINDNLNMNSYNITNVDSIYVKKVCLNPTCNAVIYWNGNSLVIEAPNIIVVKTQ